MRIVKANDYGYRKVITVVLNPNDPQWLHETAASGVRIAAPVGHTGDTEAAGTVCGLCRSNWQYTEFIWTGDALNVRLNKFGNPVHDDQEITSTRARVWNELYEEVETSLGGPVTRTGMPRQAAPAAKPEVEPTPEPTPVPPPPPAFEFEAKGAPYMDSVDGVPIARQRYGVKRRGVPTMNFIAEGQTKTAFAKDLAVKTKESKGAILAKEAGVAKATAIIGG